MLPTPPLVRPSKDEDLPAIQAIYAHAVMHGTGTFETKAPDLAEMGRRREGVLAAGWPWLVAESGGVVVGYAYAMQFRPRRAYRYCLEDSVYVADAEHGRGIGRLLLAELVARCETLGARQMLAAIGDAANLGSVRLHRHLGFEYAGVLKGAGWKSGRWLDVVLMQRALGPGAASAPAET